MISGSIELRVYMSDHIAKRLRKWNGAVIYDDFKGSLVTKSDTIACISFDYFYYNVLYKARQFR